MNNLHYKDENLSDLVFNWYKPKQRLIGTKAISLHANGSLAFSRAMVEDAGLGAYSFVKIAGMPHRLIRNGEPINKHKLHIQFTNEKDDFTLSFHKPKKGPYLVGINGLLHALGINAKQISGIKHFRGERTSIGELLTVYL